MKVRTSKLDEQQERKLLEIESRGFWLAFWGLLIALIVEMLVLEDIRGVFGVWIVFMGMALYMGISCYRAGIWDRRQDMSPKNCLVISVAGGVVVAVVMFVFTFMRYGKLWGSLATGVFMGLFCFALGYAALRLAARATKKRQDELNKEPED